MRTWIKKTAMGKKILFDADVLIHFEKGGQLDLLPEVFEAFDSTDFVLHLNNNDIEIKEYSVIHIRNLHYARTTKKHHLNKSYHNQDFNPRLLNLQLKPIFDKIDQSGKYNGESLHKIAFRYLNVDYLIWTDVRTKQVRGKGNIPYRRLNTFYPVEDPGALQDLSKNYDLQIIDQELSVSVRRNIGK